MRQPSRTATAFSIIGALLLAAVWLAAQAPAPAQPAPKEKTAVAAPPRFQQRLSQRRALLDRQELMRLRGIAQLPFVPHGRPPHFPPFFCWRPLPTPAAAIDPHRSLFVHDRATLDAADFSLKHTLTQIASQVLLVPVPGTTPVTIFRQFWDTQNSPPGVVPASPHCTGTLNGFPIDCPRNEGSEAVGPDPAIETRIGDYKVLALVNRLDLAHQGWRNCGEHRIIYGKQAAGRNFIIFEAVLPNPRPGCREGCLPVAEFWKSLSTIDDPAIRAKKLHDFYYTGLPGFRPVVHVNHYSANGVSTTYGSSGSGQIRTNQFLQTGAFQPWLLKEFKTVIDCGVAPCTFAIVPTMVKVNPHGALWNEDNADPRAADLQADTVGQLAHLSNGTMSGFGHAVDLANDAGQSMSLAFGPGFVDDYRVQMNGAAAVGFRAALGAGALTADQIANRALTQSCAGCHMPGTFALDLPNSIGAVTTPVGSVAPVIDSWPDVVPAGFVHVDVTTSVRPELAANPLAFGAGNGQEISPALLGFFLPDRKNFLLAQLNAPRCLCVNRFPFLDPAKLRIARAAEARVDQQFGPKIDAIDRQIAEAEGLRSADRPIAPLVEQKTQLLAEREKALSAELARSGVALPDAESVDLKPQPMRLRAGVTAGRDPVRAQALRVAEVNELLRREPPRRTVTGSFRVH